MGWFDLIDDDLKEDTTLEKLVVISFSKGYTTFRTQDSQILVYLLISFVK